MYVCVSSHHGSQNRQENSADYGIVADFSEHSHHKAQHKGESYWMDVPQRQEILSKPERQVGYLDKQAWFTIVYLHTNIGYKYSVMKFFIFVSDSFSLMHHFVCCNTFHAAILSMQKDIYMYCK